MKKLVAMFLTLVMILSFVPLGVIANAVDSDDFEVSVFWYDFSDAFLSTVRTALDAELSAAGINYTNWDAQNDQARQNNQIDNAIAQGTDLLIVNIVEVYDDSAQAIVNKAKAADIPIIFFNREVSDEVINSYDEACFVGTRAAEAGEKQGIMAGNYILDNYDAVDLNGDGKISYIMMKGQIGSPEAEVRTYESIIFANAILEDAGKPALVYYDSKNTDKFQATDWRKDLAFNQMETALGTNPMNGNSPIEVVFANNDDAALGCIEALNNKGWNTGEGNSIPVFGIDYIYDAAVAIESGKMTGSILQSATGMAETVAVLAENVSNGKHVFANTEDFNVDYSSAKIRVPYEIKMDGYVDYPYPDYPENDDFHVSVFWYDFRDAFLSTVRDSLNNQLENWDIYNYTNYDARNYQATQNDQIDTAIAQGTNLLIVNIVDTWDDDYAKAIVNKAKAADLPIIFFNREVSDEVINSYDEACFVGTNPAEAGIVQGIMAGEYIVENYDTVDLNGDGKISYIMMKGELGNAEAEMRTMYAVEYANLVLKEAGKPELVYFNPKNTDKFQVTNWMKSEAFNQMETALGTNPMNGTAPIELVFANNDDAALGCIEALNNKGWNTGDGDSIPVFGIDYTYDAAEAIEAGQMTGSVLNSYEGMAYTIAWLADNVHYDVPVFTGANDNFNVDEGVKKIRVPYEGITGDRGEYREIDVSVFWYDYADQFHAYIRDSLDEYFAGWGIENYTNFDAQCNQSIQNDQIDTAIAQGTDLLIVNIVETGNQNAAQAIVDKAEEAGIPVIFFMREPADYVINSYENACFVGSDFEEAGMAQGVMAGAYIASYYEKLDLNGDGKISYIMMKGQLGNPDAEARTRYSIEYANAILEELEYPTLEYYDPSNNDKYEVADWNYDMAYNEMKAALTTNPMTGDAPIEAVFANNDDAALGCIKALNEIGYNTGNNTFIPVFGIDYTYDGANAIEANKMTGSILQSYDNIAYIITWLADNVQIGSHVFDYTDDFNVDEGVNKIRAPYEIIVNEYPASTVLGDVNDDYRLSNKDLVLLARYLIESITTLPNLDNADFNNDGRISNADLVHLARALLDD